MSTHRPAASPSWRNRPWLSFAVLACLSAALIGLNVVASGGAIEFGSLATVASMPPAPESCVGSASCTTAAKAVLTIGMTVSDMDRSLDFYTGVLQFTKLSDVEFVGRSYEHLQGVFGLRMRVCTLRLGDETIELTEYLAPSGRPIPVDSRSNDRWFQHVAIIVSDMNRAYSRLREHKVGHASTGPQTIPSWNAKAGGIRAFYFKDPDNHVLEVLQFPPDKGRAKWHRSDALFLGIDHSAIVVQDTDASIRFYRDVLGMIVAGESENFGVEQEHLNNVFGARLRITSLRCAGAAESVGPSVELLEYLSPSDGRPYPVDSRANDLWHWQITMRTDDAASTQRVLQAAHVPFISPGIVELNGHPAGAIAGCLVRDPDGHAVRCVQMGPTMSASPRQAQP